ncbi:MAG: lytic transglycosylase domain-containing protein [Parcubacteria group bacterium]|jgi:hypothetical protein
MKNIEEIKIFHPDLNVSPNAPLNSRRNLKNPLSEKNYKENINHSRRKFLVGAAILALDSTFPKEVSEKTNIVPRILNHIKSLFNDEDKPKENDQKQENEKMPEKKEASPQMQLLAQEVQIRAHELLKKDKFLPKKLFSENLFLAVQIQESNLEKDAESQAGAIGIMQVKPITVKEVIRYLNILKNNETIKFEGPSAKELSENNVAELMTLIKQNKDLGKAFGKLYFAELFNNFEIGKQAFELGQINQARKKILTAYNWSPNNFKRNENNESAWPLESIQYCDKVLDNLSRLDFIQKEIRKLKIKTDILDLSALLTMELNKYKDIDVENSSFEKMIQSYLEKISTIETIKERPLKKDEIANLISKFNYSVYRLYANLK